MKFRFGEPDRDSYGDQWFEVDPLRLDWERPGMTGLIERFECEDLGGTGYTFAVTLPAKLAKGEHRALRAVLWWALLLDGQDVAWADFEPRMDLVEYEKAVGRGNSPGPASRATGGRSTGSRSTTTSKRTKSS